MTNALANTQPVSRDDWSVMLEQATMLVKTNFLPKDVNTPEKAVAIMLKGRELNIPPMHALSTIAVIQGKPTVSPELMAALVERDYGSNALIVEETNPERCVVSCCKPGWDKRRVVSFSMQEAIAAGLPNKNPTWKTYPEAMLRSRAISKACKTHFQASIGGMYTPEEMGAVVNEDGAYEALPTDQALPGVAISMAEFRQPHVEPSPADIEAMKEDDPDYPEYRELPDDEPIEVTARRTEIIELLRDAQSQGALRIAKRAASDAGFGDDPAVTDAYWDAHERLHGASTASEQPALA